MRRSRFASLALRAHFFLLITICSAHGLASNVSWVGGWYAPPLGFMPQLSNVTIQYSTHLSIDGSKIRIRLSNAFGESPLNIGEAYVHLGGLTRQITFRGKVSVLLAAGDEMRSDPIDLSVQRNEELKISIYYPKLVPKELTMITASLDQVVTPGNTAVQPKPPAESTSPLGFSYFLTGIEVEGDGARGTIVTLGDSITADGRWPAILSERLLGAGKRYSVINSAIGGNRILQEIANPSGMLGVSAIRRFSRDVLDQPRVQYVIIYEGINDLGLGELSSIDGSHPPTAEALERAIQWLAQQAHDRGIKIFVATLAPFEGTTISKSYFSTEKNEVRKRLNAWIRSTQSIDGYFDVDESLADPDHRERLRPDFDSGDHLHPNGAGQEEIGNCIDLSKFQ